MSSFLSEDAAARFATFSKTNLRDATVNLFALTSECACVGTQRERQFVKKVTSDDPMHA
jgi:hypothetical protein